MCDYSLQSVASRPAAVNDKLTTRNFGTGTRGFGASEDRTMAVCLLPGTEVAFAVEVVIEFGEFLRPEREDPKAQHRDLPPDRQGYAAYASRRTGISGRANRAPDQAARGPGGHGAATSGPAYDVSRI